MGAIFDYISFVSSFFPVIVGWILYRKLPKDLKLFLYYFTFAAVYDLYVTWLAIHNTNNLRELNIYTILETYILLYLYGLFWDHAPSKKILWVAGFLFTIIWVWINLITNSLATFTIQDESIKCVLFMILSARLIFIISKNINVPLFSNYRFWLIAAFLIYFSATFVVFSTSTWVFESSNQTAMKLTWAIHACVTILTNCIASYAFICFYRRKNLLY